MVNTTVMPVLNTMGGQRDRKAYGCVIRSDRKRLRHLLGKHAELRTSPNAWIVAAAVLDNPRMLPWLFSRGVSPDSRLGDGGDTPLMLAIAYDDLAVMQVLLDHGADPNARDPLGDTCFTRAIIDRKPGAMRLLAENGADLKLVDELEVRWAAENGHTDVLEVLHEPGVPVPDSATHRDLA